MINADLMNPLFNNRASQHKQQDRVDLKVQQIIKTEGEQRQKLAAMNRRFDKKLKEKAKKLSGLNVVKKNVMFESPM